MKWCEVKKRKPCHHRLFASLRIKALKNYENDFAAFEEDISDSVFIARIFIIRDNQRTGTGCFSRGYVC
jgi:hypothetical protein